MLDSGRRCCPVRLHQARTFSEYWSRVCSRVWKRLGTRISTSKSKAIVLDQKRVACPLQVGGEVLPQVEELKYLSQVLFTSERKMECEIDRQIGAASADYARSVYRTVVVKKELSRKASQSTLPLSPMVMNFG
ncbi:hypothetical protein L3Q82_011634 [Scortum barcoo]|uniref:Uncharacterized protein n=1 Tax=Scortum barcoo TaxID=214431 RepID=A0ACB8W588_9TELE|nr:hypothetical protein L3Q82_011634 [Scortum barcoo]